jgi:hypothetical protein
MTSDTGPVLQLSAPEAKLSSRMTVPEIAGKLAVGQMAVYRMLEEKIIPNSPHPDRAGRSGGASRSPDAEAARRLRVQRESEEAQKADAPPPLTLGGLLNEYFADQE